MSTTIAATTAVPVYGKTESVTTGMQSRFGPVIAKLSLMVSIYNERRQMRKLSDEALRDMGISRSDAEAEYRRAFGDVTGCHR